MVEKTRFQVSHVLVRAVSLIGGVFALSLALYVWQVFVNTERGQIIDDIAFKGSYGLKGELWWLAGPILEVVSTVYIGGAIFVVGAIALIRKRWWLAIQAIMLIVGANVTTQLLKKMVLDRPDFGAVWAPGNSLPSGHTTAAASVSLALLLVVPRVWRPWAAVAGAIYTTATGVSTLVGQWHRASDVIAAVFVCGAWALGICAVSKLPDDEPSERRPMNTVTIIVLVTMVLATLVCAAAAYHYLEGAFTHWENLELAAVTIEREAFLGASFAVLSTSIAVFATSLMMRQAVARMR